jgi:heme exporter protein C
MRVKIMIALAVLSGAILSWNLHTMFLRVPDELNQGAIFRIIYFHVPSAITSFTGFFFAMFSSVAYLAWKNLKFDAIAASINEVSLAFATITLITGSLWGRIAWGIWWTWDARLTSYFICWLLYVGYLMLRRAIDDPTTRARLCAVLSIFACADIVIVWKSIEWFRTQHPGMEAPIWWNLLALLMLAAVLIMMRMRQDAMQREIDSLRRYAHAF